MHVHYFYGEKGEKYLNINFHSKIAATFIEGKSEEFILLNENENKI